jgi:hypothetical protein
MATNLIFLEYIKRAEIYSVKIEAVTMALPFDIRCFIQYLVSLALVQHTFFVTDDVYFTPSAII